MSQKSEQNKWGRRDKKRHVGKNGMKVSGKSVFTIQNELIKRANKDK